MCGIWTDGPGPVVAHRLYILLRFKFLFGPGNLDVPFFGQLWDGEVSESKG